MKKYNLVHFLFLLATFTMAQNTPNPIKPSYQDGTYYSWNLMKNPGFEMGSFLWTSINSSTFETSSTNPYSDIRSARVYNRILSTQGIQQDISEQISRKGTGEYWLGAAVRVASGTDKMILKLESGGSVISYSAVCNASWIYVYTKVNLTTIGTYSKISIYTENGTSDLFVDEVWLRKAEDLSQYNFNYPATYPVVQTFRQGNNDENAYFPIIYNMFNSGVLSGNQGSRIKILIGQSSWGALLNWGKLQYSLYPYENRGNFFPGWYAYYAGTKITADIDVTTTSVQVVSGATLMKAGNGLYFDAALIARNSDGTSNWNKVEHVKITAVSGNSVTITRGDYNSPVFAFTTAENAYLAQKPGWISGNDQWMLNLSLVGPRDPVTGMNGADFWAFYYKDFFNDRSYLNGIEFDVSGFVSGNSKNASNIDINNDGVADWGTIDGVNVAGLGNQVAIQKMRDYFGDSKILVYDYESPTQARSTKYIDGACFEAALVTNEAVGREFAYLEDINQMLTERPLRYSYLQQVPNGSGSISDPIGRIGIAAASMLEIPYVNQFSRDLGVVWWRDEYFGGNDINKQGWLGEPIGPIVRNIHFDPSANLLATATWSLQQTTAGYAATFENTNGTLTANVMQTKGDVSALQIASNYSVSNLVDGASYSLIFEARGDDNFTFQGQTFEKVPRYLQLINSGAVGNTVNSLSSIGENLTDDWRLYEISFPASGTTDATKKISFGISEMTGTTQLRNVQLYKGSVHILSRQFQYGIALLNGSEYPYTFTLPNNNYRRINGQYTTDVNNNADVGNTITIPAWDGILLVDKSTISALAVVKSTSKIKIFPNPAQNVLNLTFDQPETNSNIRIFNAQGTEFYNKIVGQNNLKLDVSKFSPGLYFLQVSGINEIQKLIIK